MPKAVPTDPAIRPDRSQHVDRTQERRPSFVDRRQVKTTTDTYGDSSKHPDRSQSLVRPHRPAGTADTGVDAVVEAFVTGTSAASHVFRNLVHDMGGSVEGAVVTAPTDGDWLRDKNDIVVRFKSATEPASLNAVLDGLSRTGCLEHLVRQMATPTDGFREDGLELSAWLRQLTGSDYNDFSQLNTSNAQALCVELAKSSDTLAQNVAKNFYTQFPELKPAAPSTPTVADYYTGRATGAGGSSGGAGLTDRGATMDDVRSGSGTHLARVPDATVVFSGERADMSYTFNKLLFLTGHKVEDGEVVETHKVYNLSTSQKDEVYTYLARELKTSDALNQVVYHLGQVELGRPGQTALDSLVRLMAQDDTRSDFADFAKVVTGADHLSTREYLDRNPTALKSEAEAKCAFTKLGSEATAAMLTALTRATPTGNPLVATTVSSFFDSVNNTKLERVVGAVDLPAVLEACGRREAAVRAELAERAPYFGNEWARSKMLAVLDA